MTISAHKILLTGCSGYIGSSLAKRLKQRGFSVFGLDRKPYPHPKLDLDGMIHGDLRDAAVLNQIPDGVDTVCHLAAAKDDWGLSDQEYFDDNVTATRKLLDFGRKRGIRKWLFFSSVGVLGASATALDESAPFAPVTAYGESKAEGEKLFRRYSQTEDPAAQISILRPSVVFGPGNPSNTNVYRLIDALYNHRFVMIGKGDAIKTTSYIDNVVGAALFLLDRMTEGVHAFIYVDEPKLSTAEMVQQICESLGKKPPSWSIPLGVAAPLAHLADVAAAVTRIDLPITAARIKKFCRPTNFDGTMIRNLGFKQPVSMAEALRRSVEWYLTTKESKASSEIGVPSERL